MCYVSCCTVGANGVSRAVSGRVCTVHYLDLTKAPLCLGGLVHYGLSEEGGRDFHVESFETSGRFLGKATLSREVAILRPPSKMSELQRGK